MKTAKKLALFVLCLAVVLAAIMIIYDIATKNRAPQEPEQPDQPQAEEYPLDDSAQPSTQELVQDGEFIASYTLSIPEGYTKDSMGGKTTYTEGSSFISIEIVPHEEAREIAPPYMDNFIDFKDIEFMGGGKMLGTDYSAQLISASNDSSACEAWLIDV
ncbi:MAG: hypothetical protein IJ072_02110, partial [Oscillospiraceae bacterium]|nr:hypothetical protein [Oscillospiraceae bacterium]